MSQVAITNVNPLASPMGRKKAEDSAISNVGGQVSFKASKPLWTRIQRICRVLEIDAANLARMVITEHLHNYEQRVDEIERRQREREQAD